MDKPIENFYTYLYLKIYQNTYIFVQYWYKPSTYLLAYLIVTYFPTHVPIHLYCTFYFFTIKSFFGRLIYLIPLFKASMGGN